MGVDKRVIAIYTDSQKVEAMTVTRLEDMQEIVGGNIERACILDNGDEVYVNDEGLFQEPLHFFTINGAGPFAGNAYVIGKVDSRGYNTHVASTEEEIGMGVEFLSARTVKELYDIG